jgi:hypothetical protein
MIACAAFIKESRMKFTPLANNHKKSGGVGHPGLFYKDKVTIPSCFICGRRPSHLLELRLLWSGRRRRR